MNSAFMKLPKFCWIFSVKKKWTAFGERRVAYIICSYSLDPNHQFVYELVLNNNWINISNCKMELDPARFCWSLNDVGDAWPFRSCRFGTDGPSSSPALNQFLYYHLYDVRIRPKTRKIFFRIQTLLTKKRTNMKLFQ